MESTKPIKTRKDKSDRATTDKVLDPKTMLILKKLEEKGVLKNIEGCISSGKEANIYLGTCVGELSCKFMRNTGCGDEKTSDDHNYTTSNENKIQQLCGNDENNKNSIRDRATEGEIELVGTQDIPVKNIERPVVIKIYRTSRLEFRKRQKYIENESRFKSYCNTNPRKLIKLWAEKEMRNLKRLCKAGIAAPEPLYLKRNVLIMSMVGGDQPALRLKDLEDANFENLYIQTIDIIKDMYIRAKIVHCDLSEYNLLLDKKIFVIDVGQSVDVYHQNADSFLINDL
ncbi:putative serine/threonine-protein kinase RIO1 like protein, partial [Dictyocoela roeselum]